MDRTGALIDRTWTETVGEDRPDVTLSLQLDGERGHLPSAFPVEDVAVAAVASALMAASALGHQRSGGSAPELRLHRGHVAAAVRSERYFRIGSRGAGLGFAELSRFWQTSDGWVRTHANFPWHRQALLTVLGVDEDPVAVAAAMAERSADEVEDTVCSAGGIAGKVRTIAEWAGHPQGSAVNGEPLISHERVGDAPARSRGPAELPATGIKVVDLTRVIAGPVCTRYLGALGADVVRIDPPHRPDLDLGAPADTLLGKRSAVLDLREERGLSVLEQLLADADVIVCGYRPGALDAFGLGPAVLAERYPGLVAVYLAAWGHTGPWANRRGFDSIVQAPSGIAIGESPDGKTPGALPCQLLDHATGYLAAAAVLDGLRRQADQGGTHVRRVSLARTAHWLTSAGQSDGAGGGVHVEDSVEEWLGTTDSAAGPVTAVRPPGRIGDLHLTWPSPARVYGDATAEW